MSDSLDKGERGLAELLFTDNHEISRPTTKTAFALETLRNAILDGRIDGATNFDIRSLSQSLHMSVTPVREALRILQTEGLLTHADHKQLSVVEANPGDADEVYELRVLLEGILAGHAARRETAELSARDELTAHQKDFEKAVRSGDHDVTRRMNRAWHMHIYRMADRKYTLQVVGRLWAMFDWTGIWDVPGRLEQSLREHEAISTAILDRDHESATRLMRAHIRGGAVMVVEAASDRQNEVNGERG